VKGVFPDPAGRAAPSPGGGCGKFPTSEDARTRSKDKARVRAFYRGETCRGDDKLRQGDRGPPLRKGREMAAHQGTTGSKSD